MSTTAIRESVRDLLLRLQTYSIEQNKLQVNLNNAGEAIRTNETVRFINFTQRFTGVVTGI